VIGVIGGTGLRELGLFERPGKKNVKTEYGIVKLFLNDKICFIPRHGVSHNIPPHMINHKANMKAFESLGIKEIIGVSSVGGLNEEYNPGSIVIPDDYIDCFSNVTFYDKKINHITPGFDKEVRDKIIYSIDKLDINHINQGVYFQTRGPRLETMAEVRMFSRFGDIVGMTAASEATLAREIGLKYAVIASIDNYAHGVGDEPLDFEEVLSKAGQNKDAIELIINEVLTNK